MTTATAAKARRGRTAGNNAEIRVRLNAKTKAKAARLFKRHGLSTADGVRRLIDSAVADADPWLACKMSSHIPNAETARLIEEGLAEKTAPMTLEEIRKMWDDE